MYPVCSFCGDRPVVAWFEGPSFRDAVDSADKVRAEEAWLTCQVCLTLIEANDREGASGAKRRAAATKGQDGRSDPDSRRGGDAQAHAAGPLRALFWTPRSA
jgi:hypothetical protein